MNDALFAVSIAGGEFQPLQTAAGAKAATDFGGNANVTNTVLANIALPARTLIIVASRGPATKITLSGLMFEFPIALTKAPRSSANAVNEADAAVSGTTLASKPGGVTVSPAKLLKAATSMPRPALAARILPMMALAVSGVLLSISLVTALSSMIFFIGPTTIELNVHCSAGAGIPSPTKIA